MLFDERCWKTDSLEDGAEESADDLRPFATQTRAPTQAATAAQNYQYVNKCNEERAKYNAQFGQYPPRK